MKSIERASPGPHPPGNFHSWIFVSSAPAQATGAVAAFFDRSLETDPDIVIIQPEEGETSIKIEQVRELHQLLATRSLTGRGRLVLVSPAEKISLAGQQALLKLLEEPPENTLIALIAKSAASLPGTVQSRCRVVQLPESEKEEGGGVLTQIAEAASAAQRVKLVTNLPTDREDLKQFLANELALPVPPTREGITLKARALEAYEALQGNVTPQLALDRLIN